MRELLSDTKYGIDYYQREYKWQTKQIVELVSDLTTAFLEEYQPQHERKDVASYGHYFLGSIVISQPDEKKQIVDGQQRLTSLTLLLIYLHNIQKDRPDAVSIEKMIFSEEYGEKSFNLDIPERNECMNALFDGTPYDAVDQVESIQNLIGRYNDIVEAFPAEIANDKALPYFVDWLRNKTQLVEITAYADADAYEIEHLWANHFERHTDEFAHAQEFSTHRNRVGGLVLLPKKINASLNDKAYSDKLEHYQSENLLARSLHPMCYVHNPGFLKLKAETGLPFKAFVEFKKANFDERFRLYKGIAELLWSADRLKEVA